MLFNVSKGRPIKEVGEILFEACRQVLTRPYEPDQVSTIGPMPFCLNIDKSSSGPNLPDEGDTGVSAPHKVSTSSSCITMLSRSSVDRWTLNVFNVPLNQHAAKLLTFLTTHLQPMSLPGHGLTHKEGNPYPFHLYKIWFDTSASLLYVFDE